MNRSLILVIGISLTVLSFLSCVPKKQFLELKEKNAVCVIERDSLKNQNEDLRVKNTEQSSTLEELNRQLTTLQKQISSLEDSLEFYMKGYKLKKNMYEELLSKQTELLKGNEKETGLLLADLQTTKEDLVQREEKLRELEQALELKRKNLDELKMELDKQNIRLTVMDSTLKNREQELVLKEARVTELENILQAKDSVVVALKNTISAALTGFVNNGLTVQMRNGKVYISLDEKLLFKFGSTDVDSKGITALKKLAQVLEQNQDINIMIEGHTDDVGDVYYNWDLSVKRATAVVKILLQNSKIDPIRLTASGRGQWMPVNPEKTDVARTKNRRTEIILTPKLDELFKILETN